MARRPNLARQTVQSGLQQDSKIVWTIYVSIYILLDSVLSPGLNDPLLLLPNYSLILIDVIFRMK